MGMAKGKIWIASDFDQNDPEIEALFYDAPPATGVPRRRKGSRKR